MNNMLQKLLVSASTFALAAVIPAETAFAQDQQSPADIEQVVVSASRVTIAGYSQPTPVTVVGSAQLEQDAFSNIADSVRDLPQVSSPPTSLGSTQAQPAQGTAGTNFINLRALGTLRTLVLIDSQRMAPATVATNVDVTTFPEAVIQRVDIVTGGASASWGSDAVAGVANFVINKNINGFHATVQGGDNMNNTVRDYMGEATWGEDIFGGRGHIEVAGSAHIRPDWALNINQQWYRGSYWVSNPAYAAGNGQPQLIVANNVGNASATAGGIISSSPKGTGANPAAANALRGIMFVQGGAPQLVNYGNLTQGVLSNGGSLGEYESQDPFGTLSNPTSTYAFFAYGRYKLTDTIQASAQFNYGYFTGKGQSVPVQQNAVVIASDNAYIPSSIASVIQAGGITSFSLGTFNTNNFNPYISNGSNFSAQADSSLAPSDFVTRRNVFRGVFTLDGTIGDDWSWTAYIEHAASRFTTHDYGIPIVANLQAAQDAVTVTSANVGKSGLAIGSIACRSTLTGTPVVQTGGTVVAQAGCVPLDVFGIGVASPAAIAYINGASNPAIATSIDGFNFPAEPNSLNHLSQSLQLDVMEGSMQGVLPWGLDAGKVAVAFGAGYRKQQGVAISNQLAILSGYGQGSGTNMLPSQYNVLEGFAEADVPVLKNNVVNSLDFSMAGRITNYSTSGMVETWKLGATSQVNDDIKLRTTWSVDIRAPQLAELFAFSGNAFNQMKDPKTQLQVSTLGVTIGNPNLKPEVARTISGGAVFTPTFIPGLTVSADWYNISITGAITAIAAATILAQCNSQLASLINPGQNGNPNDPLCSHLVFNGPNGALSAIDTSPMNFASQTTSGMDLSANYTMDFWDGTLAWQALGNYNDEDTLTNPGVGKNDSAGSEAGSSPVGPKWRGILAATYTTGPYSFTTQSRWFGTSVVNQDGNTGNLVTTAANANLYDPAHFEIPFVAYLDLRGNYKWNDNISFFGAIDNTLNTPPPLVAPTTAAIQAAGIQFYGTNPNVYDTLGRNFRVGVRFSY